MSTSTPPRLADLQVGEVSAPITVEGISRTHFVKYAGASCDFNPMHHDDTMATRFGNPSVFGHGMLTAGITARVVKDWFGPEAMRHLAVKFTKQVWPGETLTATATITDLAEVDGEGRATLALSVVNGEGEEKLSGTATVAVPVE